MREVLQFIDQLSVQDFVLSSLLVLGLCLTIAQMMAPLSRTRKVRVVASRPERARRVRGSRRT